MYKQCPCHPPHSSIGNGNIRLHFACKVIKHLQNNLMKCQCPWNVAQSPAQRCSIQVMGQKCPPHSWLQAQGHDWLCPLVQGQRLAIWKHVALAPHNTNPMLTMITNDAFDGHLSAPASSPSCVQGWPCPQRSSSHHNAREMT